MFLMVVLALSGVCRGLSFVILIVEVCTVRPGDSGSTSGFVLEQCRL